MKTDANLKQSSGLTLAGDLTSTLTQLEMCKAEKKHLEEIYRKSKRQKDWSREHSHRMDTINGSIDFYSSVYKMQGGVL